MNNQPRFRAEPDSLSQDTWAVMEYLEQDDATVIYSDLSKQEAVIVASLLNVNPNLTWYETAKFLSGEISKEERGRLLSATPAEPAPVDWLDEAQKLFESHSPEYPNGGYIELSQAAALIAIAQELRKLTACLSTLTNGQVAFNVFDESRPF